MVQFEDGAVKAQLGMPDMRLPIQYAFSYPDRLKASFPRLDFKLCTELTFEQPDTTVSVTSPWPTKRYIVQAICLALSMPPMKWW